MVFILGLALIAFAAKLTIAYNTLGTNDAINFYGLAKALSDHSLEWCYQHSRYLNHPPLVAYYLRGIFALTEQTWAQQLGFHFPFLLRLPGIIADFLAVVILLRLSKIDILIPTWALALFALSPVSLMVSGFHGNTDSVMVLFLVCAVWMCVRDQAALAGLFFALSCQIKIVPLLFLPAFFFFWLSRHRIGSFLTTGAIATCVLWWEPISTFPILFAKNVLGYGSYWGIWGFTYCLRLTGLQQFSTVSFVDLEPIQLVIMSLFKTIIIACAVLIAWRRRNVPGQEFIRTVAYTWLIFFVFAPGVCAQYLIWLAPFILIASPTLYSWLLATSSVFLFAFYNSTARAFPWFVAISTDGRRELWAPWSLLPWFVIIAGAIIFSRRIVGRALSLPLVQSAKFGAEAA